MRKFWLLRRLRLFKPVFMNRFYFFFLAVIFCASSHAQKKDSLYQLYEAKLFPALEKANNNTAHPYYYFYKAVYANACNKPAASLDFLTKYLGKKKKPANEIAFEFYQLEHDNYVRSFQFREAARTGRYLIRKYKKRYTPDEARGTENANLIWKALMNEPLQQLEQAPLDSIPFSRDMAGLINLPVATASATANFVFDTGAGLSCITESYAAKMGIRILPDSGIQVAGFTNVYNPVRIGIAAELRIGQLLIRNEPFLVFKDEALSFANGAYQINGIIGFPVAKGLGKIVITPRQLVLEKHISDNPALEPNFFIETLRPVLMLTYKGRLRPYNFDTGANSSDFFKPFFEEDSTHLLATGKFIEKRAGSAGGVSINRVLEVPSLEFELNGRSISIPKPDIDPEKKHVSNDHLYGNIGQDLLRQYKRVIIDFGNSHLALEND